MGNRKLIPVAILLFIIFLVVGKLTILYTEWLWFGSVGRQSVFLTIIEARLALFAIVGVIYGVLLWLNCRVARGIAGKAPAPVVTRLIPIDDKLMLDRYIDSVVAVGVVVTAVVAGILASARWSHFLRFLHPKPFGVKDPQFGRDVGFYIMRLPFLQDLWQVAYVALGICLAAAVLIYLYDDVIQLGSERPYIAPQAIAHLSVVGGAMLMVKSVGYVMDGWRLLYSPRGAAFGASFVDIRATLPGLRILAVLAIVIAAALFFNAARRKFAIAAGGLAVQGIASILLLTAIPEAVQQLVVKPNELARERPYIQRNIDLTRRGFGLDRISEQLHPANHTLTTDDLTTNEATVSNIRLWDRRPLMETFSQLQGIRPYYNFADVDIDRYDLDGVRRQVAIAARELTYTGLPNRSWVSKYLKYTHGYGVCLSPVNEATPEGQPDLLVRDLPPVSETTLQVKRPGIYFGEDPDALRPQRRRSPLPLPGAQPAGPRDQESPEAEGAEPQRPRPPGPRRQAPEAPPESPFGAATGGAEMRWGDYVLVRATTPEIDYPERNALAATTYEGSAGVPISSLWRRIAFAWRFSSLSVLISPYIGRETRAIFHRRIRDRVRTITPFLRVDADPYIVIGDDGRLYWILDAYTLTNMYPYSQRTRAGNYVRNPIKVVVDAYNGTVDYYLVDETEPIAQSYADIFPGLFKPFSSMPAFLRRHIRYPRTLFAIQAALYATYHMTDPEVFYNREDQWVLPQEIYDQQPHDMEAYYLLTRLPDQDGVEYILFTPFTPENKDNMIAWLCAVCDPEHYGEMRVYKFPKGKLVWGPMQIETRIDQDTEISAGLTLWGQQGSRVIRGNLLVIPIGQSLIYVEPLYLQAERSEFPELKRVIAAYHNRVAMADSLAAALKAVLPKGAGVVKPGPTPATPKPAETTEPPSRETDTIESLAREARRHMQLANERRRQEDWDGYGRELAAVQKLLDEIAGRSPSQESKPAPSE